MPLAPGETSTITCDNSELRRPELMTWIIVPIMLQTLLGEVAVGKLASMLALLWLCCAAWLGRRGTDLTIDAQGIGEAGWRPRRLRWPDVLGCHREFTTQLARPRRLVLFTRRGRLATYLPATGQSAVAKALLDRPWATARSRFFPLLNGLGGLVVGDDGLWRIDRWRCRHLPWAEVQGVRWSPVMAELGLSRGRRLSLLPYAGAPELATLIDQRLGGPRPTSVDGLHVSPEAIERWLGVPPGGSVVCRPAAWAGPAAIAVLAALVRLVQVALTDPYNLVFLAILTPLLLPLARAMLRGVRGVDADARGLTVRYPRRRVRLPWSAVYRRDVSMWVSSIDTEQGIVPLPPWLTNGRAVLLAVDHLAEARPKGLRPLDEPPLPDTALSRLTGSQPTDDRALSLAERNEDA